MGVTFTENIDAITVFIALKKKKKNRFESLKGYYLHSRKEFPKRVIGADYLIRGPLPQSSMYIYVKGHYL